MKDNEKDKLHRIYRSLMETHGYHWLLDAPTLSGPGKGAYDRVSHDCKAEAARILEGTRNRLKVVSDIEEVCALI